MIHQLRIYEIFERNKKAFHDRSRDHAMRIMARYGLMKDRWAKFMADQEWADIKKETGRIHGPPVGEIEDRVLETTDYSPRKTP